MKSLRILFAVAVVSFTALSLLASDTNPKGPKNMKSVSGTVSEVDLEAQKFKLTYAGKTCLVSWGEMTTMSGDPEDGQKVTVVYENTSAARPGRGAAAHPAAVLAARISVHQ